MIRDIALAHGDDPRLRQHLRPYQLRALTDIATCGTAAAGLHVEQCDHCGEKRMQPNTCGHRSCPHCQGKERAEWVQARTAELLACGYFHAVLTLPPELRTMAWIYPVVVLGCLLRASSDAIDRLCRDPRHLGAEIGQLAMLHTWRRDLGWHPHVHLLVTGGGWDAAGRRWIPAKRYGRRGKSFLLPAQVLGACFLRRLRRLLLDAYDAGDFAEATLPELASRKDLNRMLAQVVARRAVLRIEPPFAGPETLLKYLGAYINRSAISPKRILDHDLVASTVTYTWTTNAEPDLARTATISAVDFLKRFAQHILPPGFHRIRYRGLWHPSRRQTALRHAQASILGAHPPTAPTDPAPPPNSPQTPEITGERCPHCGIGHYQRIPGKRERPSPAERRARLAVIRTGLRRQIPGDARKIA
jgi:hypothetical protein